MSLQDRLKYAEMKARHQKTLRPWYKKWWGLLIIIIVALLLVATIYYGSYYFKQTQAFLNGETTTGATSEETYAMYLKAISGDGTNYFTGPSDAKITIIEFGDFACPFCQQSAPGLRKIAEEHKDKVKVVFRDYPLHENSIDLALAARCAGAQGKFWEMYDKLYADDEPIAAMGSELQAILVTMAANLDLSTKTFEQCLLDRRFISKIKKDFDDAELLEAEGTPTWFINNYSITGHLPEDRLREIINGLLETH